MYLKSVENVITLGKLIGLLFLFCLSLLSILFLKTKRNDLARPVMGTIFLVYPSIYMTFTSLMLLSVLQLVSVVGSSTTTGGGTKSTIGDTPSTPHIIIGVVIGAVGVIVVVVVVFTVTCACCCCYKKR